MQHSSLSLSKSAKQWASEILHSLSLSDSEYNYTFFFSLCCFEDVRIEYSVCPQIFCLPTFSWRLKAMHKIWAVLFCHFLLTFYPFLFLIFINSSLNFFFLLLQSFQSLSMPLINLENWIFKPPPASILFFLFFLRISSMIFKI